MLETLLVLSYSWRLKGVSPKNETFSHGWTRNEEHTRGLRGTNLARITDRPALEAAMELAPSLREHKRPDDHTINAEQWEGVKQLFAK